MNELTINLDMKSGVPMYQQIYDYIVNGIKDGSLVKGTRLPSTRFLAKYLEISRSTVDAAYDQLVAEGYVETVPAKGYFIADIEMLLDMDVVKFDTSNKIIDEKLSNYDNTVYKYDFSPRGIDLENFPYNVWRKLSKELLSVDNMELFTTGNPQGDLNLREVISRYLFEARGVHCEAGQIIIGAGYEYLLILLRQILAQYNKTYKGQIKAAMSDPTYVQGYNVMTRLDCSVQLVPMDSKGIVVSKIDDDVNLAYIMPSHHYPTGNVMPIKRRLEMLRWSNEMQGRFIVEDDYDSEFRYVGKPIPAMAGMDTCGKVIYLGTFSRSIAPAIRMGYMVLPRELLDVYRSYFTFYSTTVSRIDQQLVHNFIAGGQYQRHLNRMRSVYKNKMEIMVRALKKMDFVKKIYGSDAGVHLLVEVDNGMTEKELIDSAKSAGIKVYGMSYYRLELEDGLSKKNEHTENIPTVVLGYASIREKDIERAVGLLKIWDK